MLKDKGLPDLNEKWLFHGTSQTKPEVIYNGEIGFDMRHSNSGMWGNGIYVAVNASYSTGGYSFKNDDDTRSIFYCRVAIGEDVTLPSDSKYRFPPEKPGRRIKNFAVERYDSIKGNTVGNDIYIVYENSRAYPDYLITFGK